MVRTSVIRTSSATRPATIRAISVDDKASRLRGIDDGVGAVDTDDLGGGAGLEDGRVVRTGGPDLAADLHAAVVGVDPLEDESGAADERRGAGAALDGLPQVAQGDGPHGDEHQQGDAPSYQGLRYERVGRERGDGAGQGPCGQHDEDQVDRRDLDE